MAIWQYGNMQNSHILLFHMQNMQNNMLNMHIVCKIICRIRNIIWKCLGGLTIKETSDRQDSACKASDNRRKETREGCKGHSA
jgi:hypothetical protein